MNPAATPRTPARVAPKAGIGTGLSREQDSVVAARTFGRKIPDKKPQAASSAGKYSGKRETTLFDVDFRGLAPLDLALKMGLASVRVQSTGGAHGNVWIDGELDSGDNPHLLEGP